MENYLSHFGSSNSSQDISAHKASDSLRTVSGSTQGALNQMHIITNAMRHGLSTAVHTSSPVIKEYDTLHCAFHKPAMTQPLASQSVSPSVQSSPAHSKPSVRQSSPVQHIPSHQSVSPVQSSTFQAISPSVQSSPVQHIPSHTTILVLTYTSIFSLRTHIKF